MPSDIPADVAYIGGVFSEAILYGMHILIFGAICSAILRKSYPMRMWRGSTTIILFTWSFVMFALSTAHIGLAIQSLFEGFISQKSFDTEAFFRENVFPNRKAVYIINMILGDGLLVWRVFMIWPDPWKVGYIPLLTLFGTTACGIKTIIANAPVSHDSNFDPHILSWVTSTFFLNIATQIIATFLLTLRIYRGGANCYDRSYYMFILRLVVESGAIYTSTALIQLVIYLLKMNAGALTECMLAQICAIAPGLVIVRVASGSTLSKGLNFFETSQGSDVV